MTSFSLGQTKLSVIYQCPHEAGVRRHMVERGSTVPRTNLAVGLSGT